MAMAVLLAAPAARAAEPGVCGEDTAQWFCTGAVAFETLSVAADPEQPAPGDAVRLRVSFEARPLDPAAECQEAVLWRREPAVAGRQITVSLLRVGTQCPGPAPPSPAMRREILTWDLPQTLEPGVQIVSFGSAALFQKPPQFRFLVGPPASVLRLRDGLVGVVVDRGLEGGGSARAAAVALTHESGTFAFYGTSNVEVTVKILDGRAINGRYWLFAASMTDRPFTLSVLENHGGCLDRPGDPAVNCPALRRYSANAGQNRNFIDTEAF
jgi:hypothetical protein